MNIKSCTERFLAESGLNFTVFRLCGFMQARRALRASALRPMPARCTLSSPQPLNNAGHHRQLRGAHP